MKKYTYIIVLFLFASCVVGENSKRHVKSNERLLFIEHTWLRTILVSIKTDSLYFRQEIKTNYFKYLKNKKDSIVQITLPIKRINSSDIEEVFVIYQPITLPPIFNDSIKNIVNKTNPRGYSRTYKNEDRDYSFWDYDNESMPIFDTIHLFKAKQGDISSSFGDKILLLKVTKGTKILKKVKNRKIKPPLMN